MNEGRLGSSDKKADNSAIHNSSFVIRHLREQYDAYVDTYRGADGKLPEMMQLKRAHTAMVVSYAEQIANGEGFDAPTRAAAVAAALLHDTGRYEQLRRYNTFRDCDSVDHAVLSHDIVREQGWLDGYEHKEPVLAAVLYHNRRDVPDGITPLTATLSHTVRDADKLDIFNVLERLTAKPGWREDRRAFWNLDMDARPNPVVVGAIAAGNPVDYQNIRSLADFVLIQVGWMISQLHFATSRRICRDLGHLAFRRTFLKSLTSDPSIDMLCDMAAEALQT